MLRRIATAWAVFAVLAMGFLVPSRGGPRVGDGATADGGATGLGAAAISARRPRTRLAGTTGVSGGPHPAGLAAPPALVPQRISFVPDADGQPLTLADPGRPRS